MFGPVCEIDVLLNDAENRKTAELKTEDGKVEKHYLFYDGESVSGKVNCVCVIYHMSQCVGPAHMKHSLNLLSLSAQQIVSVFNGFLSLFWVHCFKSSGKLRFF